MIKHKGRFTPLESPVACHVDGQFSDSLSASGGLKRTKAPRELLTVLTNYLFLLDIFLCAFVLNFFVFSYSFGGSNNGDWPMFQRNPTHNGQSNAELRPPLKIRWSFPVYGERDSVPYHPIEMSSPAVKNGILYVGTQKGRLLAVDIERKKVIWEYETGGPIESSPAYDQENVYFGSNDGFFYALSATSGQLKWKFRARTEIFSSPVIGEGKVYFPSANDILYALDARTGKWRWQYNMETAQSLSIRGASSPTYHNSFIYAGFSDGSIACLKADDGSLVWKRNISEGGQFTDIVSSPTVDHDLIYISSYDGYLFALSLLDGAIKWSFKDGGASSCALKGDKLYFTSLKGLFYAFDKDSGRKLWELNLGGEGTLSSPAISGDKIFVASSEGSIYCLDSSEGEVLWSFTASSGFSSNPVIAANNLFLISNGGYIYRFSSKRQNRTEEWEDLLDF